MNKTTSLCLNVVAVIVLFALMLPWSFPGERQAARRIEQFIHAVNANRPGDVYLFLTPELRGMLSREEFSNNFRQERSYPYLTPLFLYFEKVTLAPDKLSGEAELIVAARLPGEKKKVHIIYHRGQYYLEAFREIADGTYLEKFKARQ